VAVAICTLRAEADLARAVAGVLPQLGGGELLIVRSGEATAAVPPVLGPLDQRVRMVAEPRTSSAAAREAALAAARAPVVLFLDDDCEPAPGWVDGLRAAMGPEGVAAAGGTIVPLWPGARPRWLHPRLASSYGERSAGTTRHEPFAANLAVRTSAVAAVGGLDLDLGHRDGVPGLHEETELMSRLRRRGWGVVDAPSAVVHHRVRADQVRRRWLLRRCWHEGRSDALVDRRHQRDDRPARAAKLAGLLVLLLPSQVAPRWGMYVTARLLVNAGYLTEWRRQVRATDGSGP
jgi:hypothetical protein